MPVSSHLKATVSCWDRCKFEHFLGLYKTIEKNYLQLAIRQLNHELRNNFD